MRTVRCGWCGEDILPDDPQCSWGDIAYHPACFYEALEYALEYDITEVERTHQP
jgi:hypothetical protein